jgi:hypothetical protein
MICLNCRHEIVAYHYSVRDNTTIPSSMVTEFDVYQHVGGSIFNGKSFCSKRLWPITNIKDWEDPAGWCPCDNPEPLDESTASTGGKRYESTSTP